MRINKDLKIRLCIEERMFLFNALNVYQNIGINNLKNQLKDFIEYKNDNEIKRILDDWIEQGRKEYEKINELKEKLKINVGEQI